MKRGRARKRRLLTALVAVILAMGFVPAVASASPFPDVADDAWYAEAVTWAKDNGVFNGYADGTFGPENELLREQAAGVFYNYLGDKATAPATTLGDVVQSEWYAGPVNWAVDSGTMTGYDGGVRFGVDDALTREQMAVVMARVCKADLSSVDTSKLDSLHGGGGTSDWARPSVAWAVEHGVVNGFAESDGSRTLSPQGTITRSQMAPPTAGRWRTASTL